MPFRLNVSNCFETLSVIGETLPFTQIFLCSSRAYRANLLDRMLLSSHIYKLIYYHFTVLYPTINGKLGTYIIIYAKVPQIVR